MTKQQCLPGISLQIEECIQCGASSGLSETLGESMAMRLAYILHIFQVVSIPVSVPISPFLFLFPHFRIFQLPK